MKRNKVAVIGLCGESIFMETDHFHNEGETVVVDNLMNEVGGKGFNQAVTISRMGVTTAFLGSIGDDDIGEKCKEQLKIENIEDYLCVKPHTSSAFATILTDKRGENQVSVFPGASALLSTEDVKRFEKVIKESKYLLLQLEIPREIVEMAITMANQYQTLVILNPAPAKSWIKSFLDKVFLTTPNLHEARVLYDIPEDIPISELGLYLTQQKNVQTIVTLGKEGALIVEYQKYQYIPSFCKNQEDVQDTTGAGDVFNGAFVSALVRGMSLSEAAVFGVRASGKSVQKKYVLASIPYKNEI